MSGAKVVLVDVNAQTLSMDTKDLIKLIKIQKLLCQFMFLKICDMQKKWHSKKI